MIDRRELLKAGAASFLAASTLPLAASAAEVPQARQGGNVILRGDGLSLSPSEYSALLTELTADGSLEPDYYSNGGVVAEMEAAFARALGKERAVFFPTGTLANHVAIREQARNRTRVIVQQESHVYNDSGDCLQTISSLNLIPLAPGEAAFTAEAVEGALARAAGGRVKTGVGVISIENPVRRKLGAAFDFDEMKKIAALAKAEGIRMHLDGARLYIASAYTGIPVADYAALFDTVYVSLWKYFNAASGAVLAGPADLLDAIYHTRRMFGGGLPAAWPFAAVALHFLEGFSERLARAVAVFEDFIARIRNAGFEIERIPNGTNICLLRWNKSIPMHTFRDRLIKKGIVINEPAALFDGLILTCNETVLRIEAAELADLFVEAAS